MEKRWNLITAIVLFKVVQHFVNTTKEYLIVTGLEQNSVYQLKVLLGTDYGKSKSSEEVTAETLWSNASYHLFLREELELPELEEDMKGRKLC